MFAINLCISSRGWTEVRALMRVSSVFVCTNTVTSSKMKRPCKTTNSLLSIASKRNTYFIVSKSFLPQSHLQFTRLGRLHQQQQGTFFSRVLQSPNEDIHTQAECFSQHAQRFFCFVRQSNQHCWTAEFTPTVDGWIGWLVAEAAHSTAKLGGLLDDSMPPNMKWRQKKSVVCSNPRLFKPVARQCSPQKFSNDEELQNSPFTKTLGVWFSTVRSDTEHHRPISYR